MKKITITIDGYSSCGKSTLAKALAATLNYVFIDSGSMYRAITLYFMRNNIDWTNASDITEALKKINLKFCYNKETGNCNIYLNDENVEWLIREMAVANLVSEVAALKEVREFAVAEQRKIGQYKGIVMDGRDIGTTVFPAAELKIFLTADPAVRVERRFAEMYEKNPEITIAEVKANLEMRDFIDSNREFSPLRKADDAYVLDNSNLTMKEQLKIALRLTTQRLESIGA